MTRMHIVEENPYPTKVLNHLDSMAIFGMKIFKVPMDLTVSCLYLTTPEKEQWYLYIHRFVLVFPIGLLLMALTMPINILAFALWLVIYEKRKPYRLSYCGKSRKSTRELRIKPAYGFLTTNVCLMPECMARFNNFSKSWIRSQRIGEVLARKHLPNHSLDDSEVVIDMEKTDPNHNIPKLITPSDSSICLQNQYNLPMFVHGNAPGLNNVQTSITIPDPGPKPPDFDVSVLDYMPDADFILMQEASWDMSYAKTLVRELHNIYPYVVYDIGMHSMKGNLYVGNSGLMLASKYDILELRFGLYLASCSPCWFASKGLLQVKVYLGRSPSGQDVVGYLFNTHLQAYKGNAGKRPIQNEQMDNILQWTKEFREQTLKPDEIVAFDILGGDFNLDNMSPADKEASTHGIFSKYIDIGRERQGRDHYWTKGSELRQLLLYDPHLSSPGALKRVMEDPVLMQTYLLDGDLASSTLEMASTLANRGKDGKVIHSPVGGKRRIDYILLNKQDSHLKVTQFNPVTAMYSLTDHIPYYLAADITDHQELREAFRD